MDRFLANLAALSLGGAAAIALGALVRRFTKKRYGARWRCWLWLILCLPLLCCCGPPVPISGFWPMSADGNGR